MMTVPVYYPLLYDEKSTTNKIMVERSQVGKNEGGRSQVGKIEERKQEEREKKERMNDRMKKNCPWKKRTNAAWITTIAFLDQDNFPTTTTLVSTISLFVSVAMFFLMTYTKNSIGTDLVVVESPIIMKSYQDFIDVGKSRKRGEVVAGFCKLKPSMKRIAMNHQVAWDDRCLTMV